MGTRSNSSATGSSPAPVNTTSSDKTAPKSVSASTNEEAASAAGSVKNPLKGDCSLIPATPAPVVVRSAVKRDTSWNNAPVVTNTPRLPAEKVYKPSLDQTDAF